MFISDNASQLKLGHAVINDVWNDVTKSVDIQSYISNENIEWKFITEYAPWKGGYYERLVGLTKRALRKTMCTTKVTRVELVTLIVEIEATINYRPLTYVSDDINSGEILTPAHFLSVNNKIGCPDINVMSTPDQGIRTNILQAWKKGQNHLKRFWNLWINEYLPSLRERYNVKMKSIKGEVHRNPQIGEVVIVRDDALPRGKWKVAKILKLLESEVDGVARAVKLRLPSGRITQRPLRMIYPLECDNGVKKRIFTAKKFKPAYAIGKLFAILFKFTR